MSGYDNTATIDPISYEGIQKILDGLRANENGLLELPIELFVVCHPDRVEEVTELMKLTHGTERVTI